eukprot:NODE_836_length_1870_cov_14.971993_g758_i0.p1 GENE.NODE_836_length_1870_cov_14.971993_g758_i0~~NODE_836_length_1870_cov_14.971993_g758_i0.p1  ORF type:complete len:566 (-),score=79.14 NODE_836_length_1870_cov_14.971993_g758_i0:112-1809(-)
MNFVDFEKRHNKFLLSLESNPELRAIVESVEEEQRGVLVPQNIVLEDVSITPEFTRAHVIRLDPRGWFSNLNGMVGHFSERLDAIEITETGDTELASKKLHLLRQADHFLTSGIKLNMFVVSDPLRPKHATADTSVVDMARSTDSPPTIPANRAQKPKTPTTFQFQDFVEKMRNRRARGLVQQLKTFIEGIMTDSSDNAEGLPDKVRAFLTEMQGSVAQHPLWKDANPEELDKAAEGLEKYVMTRLYPKAFAPSIEDVQKDEALKHRLSAFSQMSCTQFEVNPRVLSHETWSDAIQELRRINTFKTPRDKLICITNCCKIIFNILHAVEPKSVHGADDFLPCLIALVSQANPAHFHSNLKYIQQYRSQNHLASEAGYFLTTIQSVAYFWETADAASLHMTQAEFDGVMGSVQANSGLEPRLVSSALPVESPAEGLVSGDEYDDDNTRLVRATVAPPLETLKNNWSQEGSKESSEAPVASHSSNPPVESPVPEDFSVPLRAHSFIEEIASLVRQHSEPPPVQCTDFSELRVKDLHSLVEHYNSLLQFQKAVACICQQHSDVVDSVT